MARWIDIRDEDQFEVEVNNGSVIVIFGSSSNIGWSVALAPIRAAVSAIPGFITTLYVDGDELPQIAHQRNVTVFPTARFLRHGKKLSELKGNEVTPDNIKRNLEKLRKAEEQEV